MKADPGSSPRMQMKDGRLSPRLAFVFVVVAAFLLVPAAQAFAVPSMKVNIVGTGSGEVISEGDEGGSPPITCSYNGSSTTGTCENEVGEVEEESFRRVQLTVEPAPGSEFADWTTTEGL